MAEVSKLRAERLAEEAKAGSKQSSLRAERLAAEALARHGSQFRSDYMVATPNAPSDVTAQPIVTPEDRSRWRNLRLPGTEPQGPTIDAPARGQEMKPPPIGASAYALLPEVAASGIAGGLSGATFGGAEPILRQLPGGDALDYLKETYPGFFATGEFFGAAALIGLISGGLGAVPGIRALPRIAQEAVSGGVYGGIRGRGDLRTALGDAAMFAALGGAIKALPYAARGAKAGVRAVAKGIDFMGSSGAIRPSEGVSVPLGLQTAKKFGLEFQGAKPGGAKTLERYSFRDPMTKRTFAVANPEEVSATLQSVREDFFKKLDAKRSKGTTPKGPADLEKVHLGEEAPAPEAATRGVTAEGMASENARRDREKAATQAKYPELAKMADEMGMTLDTPWDFGKKGVSWQFSEKKGWGTLRKGGHPATINLPVGAEPTRENLLKAMEDSWQNFSKTGEAVDKPWWQTPGKIGPEPPLGQGPGDRIPFTETPLTSEEKLRAQQGAESTKAFDESLNIPGPTEPRLPSKPEVEADIDQAIKESQKPAPVPGVPDFAEPDPYRHVDELPQEVQGEPPHVQEYWVKNAARYESLIQYADQLKDLRKKASGKAAKAPYQERLDWVGKQLWEIENNVPSRAMKPTPTAETPKQAVQEIIDGKAESKIGNKDFKLQMTAELDKALAKAPAEGTDGKITISIPGDGEFTMDNNAQTIQAVKDKVKGIPATERPGAGKSKATLGSPTAINKLEGNRLEAGRFVSNGSVMIDSEALGATHRTKLSVPEGTRDPIPQDKAAPLWEKGVKDAVDEASTPLGVRTRDDFPVTLFARQGASSLGDIVAFDSKMLSQAQRVTGADGIKLGKMGENPAAVLTKGGKPVALVMGMNPTMATRAIMDNGLTIGKILKRVQFTEGKPGPVKPKKQTGTKGSLGFAPAGSTAGQGPSATPAPQVYTAPAPSKGVQKLLEKGLVSTLDIRDFMRRQLGRTSISVGKVFNRPGVLGLFRIHGQDIWTKDLDDLGTLAHEFAHYIDNQVLGTARRVMSKKLETILAGGAPVKGQKLARNFGPEHADIRNELAKLDYDPQAGRPYEGFAEYMRYRMTDPSKAALYAPKFNKWFNEEFLTKNPVLNQTVADMRALFEHYLEKMQPWEQLHSWIQRDTLKPWRNLTTQEKVDQYLTLYSERMTDDKARIEMVERQMLGGNLAEPSKSPTEIARALTRREQAMAKSIIEDGPTDFNTGKSLGPGLKKILSPFSGDEVNGVGGVWDVLMSKVMLIRSSNGIPYSAERLAQAKATIEKFDTPAKTKAAQEITKFGYSMLDMLVESGGMAPRAAAYIKKRNPLWMSMGRVFEDTEFPQSGGGGGRGRGYADLGSPVKRAKGGRGRPVDDPFLNLIDYTRRVVSTANRLRVGTALIDLAKDYEGSGRWIRPIPTPKIPKNIRVNLEKLIGQEGVEALGIDEEDVNQILTVFENISHYTGKDNVLSMWKKGKRQFFEIEPNLFRALKEMDAMTFPATFDWLVAKPARTIRLGATGLNLPFQIANFIRDIQTWPIQSQYFTGPKAAIPLAQMDPITRAAWDMYKGAENYGRFKAWGMDMSGIQGADRESMKRMVHEILANDKKAKAMNVVRHPLDLIDIIREHLSLGENAPRLAEMTLAENKWGVGTPNARIAGPNAAAEVTTNFQRMGYWGKWLNQMIPFYNPAIQGASKFGRTFFNNPKGTMMSAVASITVPSAFEWWVNHDEPWYQALEPWDKWGFYHIRVGTEKDGSPRIMRLPRPFEWGYVFGADVAATLEQAFGKDPEAVKNALGQTFAAFVPPMVPGSAQLPMEIAFNRDTWHNRPIVDYYLEKQNYPPDQYYGDETDFAMELGKMFDVSPAKIDHALRTATGGLGLESVRLFERALRTGSILPDDPGKSSAVDWPFLGRFFSRVRPPESRIKNTVLQDQLERIRQRNRYLKRGIPPDEGGTSFTPPNLPSPPSPPGPPNR